MSPTMDVVRLSLERLTDGSVRQKFCLRKRILRSIESRDPDKSSTGVDRVIHVSFLALFWFTVRTNARVRTDRSTHCRGGFFFLLLLPFHFMSRP